MSVKIITYLVESWERKFLWNTNTKISIYTYKDTVSFGFISYQPFLVF